MPSIPSQLTPQTVRNRLLRLLPPTDLERLWPSLELFELSVRSVLLAPGAVVESVHFMETGTVSMIALLEDGTQTICPRFLTLPFGTTECKYAIAASLTRCVGSLANRKGEVCDHVSHD